ncbi:MAG: ATP phosphoribosyltransferase [Coriobacteriia bacterium]|nr:ATP phosphoribosyltransferase [Coriobacteriia bacterium]
MSERPLRIALPKGTLFAPSLAILGRAGLDTGGLADPGRQLTFDKPGLRYLIVRPTDVPVFVNYGGVDCAICGKDSLLEADLDLVELVDLGFGACRFVLVEPEGEHERIEERYRHSGILRVASKYPRVSSDYLARAGVQAELIKMHGNIELAPLVGMADRVIDITATGATLAENHLVIVDEVLASTARFVANPASLRTDFRVRQLAKRLGECL